MLSSLLLSSSLFLFPSLLAFTFLKENIFSPLGLISAHITNYVALAEEGGEKKTDSNENKEKKWKIPGCKKDALDIRGLTVEIN